MANCGARRVGDPKPPPDARKLLGAQDKRSNCARKRMPAWIAERGQGLRRTLRDQLACVSIMECLVNETKDAAIGKHHRV